MKRFLLFFVLILGFVSATFAQTGTVPEVDYSAMITTFAGFVGGVVLLTEGIKALFPKMQGLATQIVSWCVGIVAAMLLWWLEAVAGCLRYDIAGRIALHRQARLPVPGMVGRTGGKFTEAVRRDRQAHRRFRNPRHQQPPPHV